jgi:hypothetical protein
MFGSLPLSVWFRGIRFGCRAVAAWVHSTPMSVSVHAVLVGVWECGSRRGGLTARCLTARAAAQCSILGLAILQSALSVLGLLGQFGRLDPGGGFRGLVTGW